MPDLVTCPRCKRTVVSVHVSEELCDGDPAGTCYIFGCGLPIYERMWDRRSRRAYCREHTRDAYRRQEQEERCIVPPDTTFNPHRPDSLLADALTPPPSSQRVLMNVHPEVRERLRQLLMAEEMRGVGYSAFINRAIDVAWDQIERQRSDALEIDEDPRSW